MDKQQGGEVLTQRVIEYREEQQQKSQRERSEKKSDRAVDASALSHLKSNPQDNRIEKSLVRA